MTTAVNSKGADRSNAKVSQIFSQSSYVLHDKKNEISTQKTGTTQSISNLDYISSSDKR